METLNSMEQQVLGASLGIAAFFGTMIIMKIIKLLIDYRIKRIWRKK
jgi:hypothetical protein